MKKLLQFARLFLRLKDALKKAVILLQLFKKRITSPVDGPVYHNAPEMAE